MRSMYWLCRSWGRRGTAAYLTDWVRGMVRMYTESATLKRSDTLNAVTGRSASMIVCEVAGATSVSQGEAASCRRNVVYAWMSTVLPLIVSRTIVAPLESVVGGGAALPGAVMAATPAMFVSQVYGGSAFVI